MNIFQYFDTLLSRKYSFSLLGNNDNIEKTFQKAYANKCYRDTNFKDIICYICGQMFSKKFLVKPDGNGMFGNKLICQ